MITINSSKGIFKIQICIYTGCFFLNCRYSESAVAGSNNWYGSKLTKGTNDAKAKRFWEKKIVQSITDMLKYSSVQWKKKKCFQSRQN